MSHIRSLLNLDLDLSLPRLAFSASLACLARLSGVHTESFRSLLGSAEL